ncbi:hypothetical protein ZIOFF_015188 [Zingiber officinale]|uniref:Uncharacterized protein n=1 Tax=Zingiber officinale TaxID=94328 RepID=A0A8J5HQX1_ZINOF|nr:hypothetical protein ZIOFF_015188 [Zingiber officinale]
MKSRNEKSGRITILLSRNTAQVANRYRQTNNACSMRGRIGKRLRYLPSSFGRGWVTGILCSDCTAVPGKLSGVYYRGTKYTGCL